MAGLTKVAFEADLLPAVANFHCGCNPWEIDVSDWIKAPRGAGGAIDEIERGFRAPAVWLHLDAALNVAAFSSLAESNWPHMPRISLIPYVAVSSDHRGNNYFREILGHLIATAQQEIADGRSPILGLFVHPDNTDAIEKYRHYEFEMGVREYRDPVTKIVYPSMFRRID